jgi:tetratricopeptide (TPR) repeat protein
LWYGIGILYERYGSLEHAEEAFNAVLKMNPNFEKKNETYFRLGVIYKQQMKLDKVKRDFVISISPALFFLTPFFINLRILDQTFLKPFRSAPGVMRNFSRRFSPQKKKSDVSSPLPFRLLTLTSSQALDCFQLILRDPPSPLGQSDILFQIGHVYEIKQCFSLSKDAYERILKDSPNHPKALQQLGWLYHHHNEPSLGMCSHVLCSPTCYFPLQVLPGIL